MGNLPSLLSCQELPDLPMRDLMFRARRELFSNCTIRCSITSTTNWPNAVKKKKIKTTKQKPQRKRNRHNIGLVINQNISKQIKNRRIRTRKCDARTNQNNISPSLSFLLSAEVKRWTSFFSSVSLVFSLFPLFSSQLSFS